MFKRLLALTSIVTLLLIALWAFTRPPLSLGTQLEVGPFSTNRLGFAQAFEPREFTFPLDHGPHPDFQTEWWYYTGNLTTADGAHVGYQLTFFRRALLPTPLTRTADFAANQIYFAHFAVTDVAGGQHHSTERFSRGAAGLAGAAGTPFGVWLEDWQVTSLTPDGSVVHLVARQDNLALDLTLTASKPLVLQGERGLSRKSLSPGNASYYVSFTRMKTEGMVTLTGQPQAVTGESWFDHEWSTSALSGGVVGWDWYSLQLSDGREIMFYVLRRADGTLEPTTSGTLIEADGSTHYLSAADVQIDVLDHWSSPRTKAQYPAHWRLAVPAAGLDLTITPWLADQEMQVSFVYWEGAVQFNGTSNGQTVTGNGYIELTGYAASMADVF